MRVFWNKVKSFRKSCVSSVLDKPSDMRPYTEVVLFGENILGLLDTGASLSCIGSKVAKQYIESGRPYRKLNSVVKTADGRSQKIYGCVETLVSFKGI